MSRKIKDRDIEIQLLGDRPEVIPVIAEWIYTEWSFMFRGGSVRQVINLFRERVNKTTLPLTLVAIRGGKPVGTVSLKEFDLESRHDLTPWVASLYVDRPWRHRGIGSNLITSVQNKAARLKFDKIFLFTVEDLVPFYEKLGWKVRETEQNNSYSVFIMENKLARAGKGKT